MTRLLFLLLSLLFSLSGPALEGNADFWQSSLAAKRVSNEAHNAADLVKLNKSLASQQQLGEVGQIMAGPGGRVPFRDAQRVTQQYGGNAADWVKKTSSSCTSGGNGTGVTSPQSTFEPLRNEEYRERG